MASTYYVKTTGGQLNVRDQPSPDGKILRKISHGTRVTVVDFQGDWRKIHSGGWVHGDYLSPRLVPSSQSGSARLPGWQQLWAEYPDYVNFTSATVRSSIGGTVYDRGYANTCAIRLSHTLNKNGILLPKSNSSLLTVKGGNGFRYSIRVRELRKWLFKKLGKPGFDLKKKADEPFDQTSLSAMKGIVGFDIKFNDATGHFDLWNGTQFSSEQVGLAEDYWGRATRIWLWTTA